jgi:predicted dithiol-disulfide oxidoreductase (DUF899 family)
MSGRQSADSRTTDSQATVSREEWIAARKKLLVREKELTRLRDQLSAERRNLPRFRVDKNYVFDGPGGKVKLADLFEGRSQLAVYHFMLGPGWQEGCVGCSFVADHIDGARQHFEHNDLSFAAVSRAPLSEIEAYKKRMGWRFRWVSSFGNDFNFDYQVSFGEADMAKGQVYYNFEKREYHGREEAPGASVFLKEGADIFHTYSTFARGLEPLLGAYDWLDLAPKGRNENGPTRSMGDWIRHHDKYGAGGHVDPTVKYVSAADSDSCCHSEEGPA